MGPNGHLGPRSRLGGAFFAYRAYVVNTYDPPASAQSLLGWAFTLADNKYYVDEVYNAYLLTAGLGGLAIGWLGRRQQGIDGAVNGVGTSPAGLASRSAACRPASGALRLSILFGAAARSWLVCREDSEPL